jgi:C4-dicarboxylate transporter DctQ subunit
MALLARLNDWLDSAFRLTIGALLIAATALVFVNVVLRYVFNYGMSWSDEVTKYSLLWLVFLGSGVAARQGGHISMEALLTLLSPRAQQLNAALVNAVCAVLSAIVGFFGWRLAMAVRTLDQVGPASGLPVFWVYLAIPVGCLLMMLGFWEVALRRLREPEGPADAEGIPGDVPGQKLSLPG